MLTNRPSAVPADQAREASPADEPAQLAELVVRTARRLHRSSIAELGPIGLTGAQARVVRYLAGLGHPARMADIAAAIEVVPRSATSVVDDLERSGFVTRAIDPRDRRSLLVSLTDDGAHLLDRLARARRRTAEATFSPLSQRERGELTRLLGLVCGGCCAVKEHGPGGAEGRHGRGNKGS